MLKQAFIYRLHKIFSVVVGIQVLLWVFSGLYMTAMPLTYVHGDHLHSESSDTPLTASEQWLSPNELLSKLNLPVTSVRIVSRLDRATYIIEADPKPMLFDAITAQMLPDLTKSEAIRIAKASYTGNKAVLSAQIINSYSEAPEIKGRALPIWQVNFGDWVSTSLYVSNIEAKVITARSSIWRVFDFLWMLHIMDYDERSDFNNPLVIFMASLAMLLILTGIILLTKGFKRSGTRYLK